MEYYVPWLMIQSTCWPLLALMNSKNDHESGYNVSVSVVYKINLENLSMAVRIKLKWTEVM